MIDPPALAQAIASSAQRWADPQYPHRQTVVEQTLSLNNRFTPEALAFAVNQQMALLSAEALLAWIGGRTVPHPTTVGVLNAGNVPLVELQDWLAVILTGAAYRGVLSSRSPFFLPAFALDVTDQYPDIDIDFIDRDEVFGEVDAVIASGSDETMAWVRAACAQNGIPDRCCLLRGHRYAVAILTGQESNQEKEGFAEDVLLHEGLGCRSVALVWAPEALSPDAYLEAFALFRGVFPVHERTPGVLKMKQAFLDAVGASHAYGEGLEFLISKGAPESQEPGHLRWVTYRTRDEVVRWIKEHDMEIQLVVTGEKLKQSLDLPVQTVPFGEAQRPSLSWCPDNVDTVAFLQSL